MCRLLAYATAHPMSVLDVLGSAQTLRFQQMARLHDDGWGTMWLDDADPTTLARERAAETGHDSVRLADALRGPASTARVVHLRLATDLMEVKECNTHPFTRGDIGFAHNGSIVPTGRLRAMLGPARQARLEGETDSEIYFELVLQAMAGGLGAGAALAEAIAQIRTAYPHASLNAMVLSPTELAVARSSRGAAVPHDDFVASGLTTEQLPLDHVDAYFRMSYRRLPGGGVVISSAGLETDGWDELPEDTVAQVGLADLRLSLIPVPDVPAAASPSAS